MNYNDAANQCNKLGLSLLTISDQIEYEYFKQVFSNVFNEYTKTWVIIKFYLTILTQLESKFFFNI